MSRTMKFLAGFIFTSYVLLGGVLQADSNPYGLSTKSHNRLISGFEQLFNSDFEAAEETLAPLKKQARRHPILALGEVVRVWWKMTSNTLEADEEESRNFEQTANWVLDIAQKKIERGDLTAEAHLALGTTLGLMSRWSAANRAWVPAFVRGNKAASYLRKALEINPNATDAYMTLGTFNYAKFLIAKKTSAEKEVEESSAKKTGLEQLRKTYEEGLYFKQASGLLLAGLLTNENPQEALPLLEKLRDELPKSPFVHIVHITALYNVGDLEGMEKEVNDFSEKIESGFYTAFYAPHAHFSRGLIEFRRKAWAQAAKEFDLATASEQDKNPYTTWSHLYKGYTLDAMGKRKEAKKEYSTVLKLQRRFASHEHAKNRMTKPFRPSDPEMRKVEL